MLGKFMDLHRKQWGHFFLKMDFITVRVTNVTSYRHRIIEIEIHPSSMSSHMPWLILKRFRDFDQLNKALQTKLESHINLPPLSPQTEMDLLQEYLTDLWRIDELMEFLIVRDALRSIIRSKVWERDEQIVNGYIHDRIHKFIKSGTFPKELNDCILQFYSKKVSVCR